MASGRDKPAHHALAGPEKGMHEHVLRGRGPNTMTLASLQELSDWLARHPDTPLLIRGEGQAFSAGLDLDALIAGDPRQISDAIEAAAQALFLHRAPTVAAVEGHAIAGGCLLLQACDLRICRDDDRIRIGMPGVALGINYPPVLMRILQYRVAPQALDRVLLEAANHAPRQALSLGLLDEVTADALGVARESLQRLAAHPPQAYAAAKRALRETAVAVPAEERQRFDRDFAAHWAAEGLRRQRRDKTR